MTDLSDLISRVEAATDRLDNETLGRVICAIEGKEFRDARISCGDDGSDELTIRVMDARDWEAVWSGYRYLAPDVSIDAAIALCERVLPGWEWEAAFTDGEYFFGLGDPLLRHEARGKSLPLCICLALLKAKEAPNA